MTGRLELLWLVLVQAGARLTSTRLCTDSDFIASYLLRQWSTERIAESLAK
jgi:hypothetical protein